MQKLIRTVPILGLLFVFAACSTVPVYNAESVPLAANKKLSIKEVEKAIRIAAADRGWTIKRRGRGRMEGRIAVRKHVAVVNITYNTRSFSIKYKDSQHLKYNRKKHQIHKNYNSWVQNLAKDINRRVAAY